MMSRGGSPDLFDDDDDDDINSAGGFDDDNQIRCMNRSGGFLNTF